MGPRAGEGAEGPWTAREESTVAESTTASPGFCPEARRASGSPTPGVEEGGKGAGKGRGVRGHEPGASPGLAPPVGRGSRPGPAQGGGAGLQGAPCATVSKRKPAELGEREEGVKPAGGEQALKAPLGAPAGALRGPARGLEGVYLPPGRAPMPPFFSLARVTSGATGAGASVGTGWGRAIPRRRCPASPPLARRGSRAPPRKRDSRELRPRAHAAFPGSAAVEAGDARLCTSPSNSPSLPTGAVDP